MKQSDWQRAYEQAPASFTGRMETTLAHLKEEEPMKKLSLRIVCIAAAAVLALMGTAIALTATGVLDTYTDIQPLPTAQSLVQKDFDQQGGENDLFTLTDPAVLEAAARETLEKNPDMVKTYLSGKTTVEKALMGKAMALTRGKADPEALRRKLLELLGKQG